MVDRTVQALATRDWAIKRMREFIEELSACEIIGDFGPKLYTIRQTADQAMTKLHLMICEPEKKDAPV